MKKILLVILIMTVLSGCSFVAKTVDRVKGNVKEEVGNTKVAVANTENGYIYKENGKYYYQSQQGGEAEEIKKEDIAKYVMKVVTR